MNWWLILLPVSGAATGFVAGRLLTAYFFRFLLPAQMPRLTEGLSSVLAAELQGPDLFAKGGDISRLFPVIESHIDDFLRNRLKIAIPMIGMMIGERTISQLKEVFMQELAAILPSVMEDYLRGIDSRALVTEKLKTLSPEKLLRPAFSKLMAIACMLTGLLVGLVNLAIVNTI